MKDNKISSHRYADDSHICLSLSLNDYNPLDSLCQCLKQENSCMELYLSQLNKNNTEIFVFGNKEKTQVSIKTKKLKLEILVF